MKNIIERRNSIKAMIVKSLELKISPDDIGDDQPLFSADEESLGLDSVEALEIVSGLESLFNVTIIPGDDPQKDFYSVSSLEEFVRKCESNNAEYTA